MYKDFLKLIWRFEMSVYYYYYYYYLKVNLATFVATFKNNVERRAFSLQLLSLSFLLL